MLSILMYLFERYITVTTSMPEPDALTDELSQAGFRIADIEAAFRWLAELEHARQTYPPKETLQTHSFRVYTTAEQQALGADNLDFLQFLQNHQIITHITRELIIDRALAMGHKQIDAEDFRWITLFVLSSQELEHQMSETMEQLIFMDHRSETLH